MPRLVFRRPRRARGSAFWHRLAGIYGFALLRAVIEILPGTRGGPLHDLASIWRGWGTMAEGGGRHL